MTTIVIATAAITWMCGPNAHHGGTVEWASDDPRTTCPVCGRRA